MEARLRLGGRTLLVTITGDQARVDEARHRLETLAAPPPQAAAGGWSVGELLLCVEGRPLRACFARRRDQVLVSIDGRVTAFMVGEETRATAGAGSGSVLAPMPGKVVRVLVAPGDAVEAGQPLVILEAMKMETTLSAEIAGTVGAVHAVVGGTVEGGAVLVEIR